MTASENAERRLRALADPDYRAFQCRLMPGIDPETVLGVRTPALRRLAGELKGSEEAEAFLRELPHRYYDENNLHACLLCACRDFNKTIADLDIFLPYVDNWATCDSLSPRAFKNCPPALWNKVPEWLASGQTYTVRFGIGTLMRFYLDEHFCPEVLSRVAALRSEAYYVNMMIAWHFATALAKQWDAALPYLTERRLEKWTHNKTIQKAIESYRISDAQKTCLRALKY